MVAPYPVVGNNKFKIKMAPGSLKKGKGNKWLLIYSWKGNIKFLLLDERN